MHFFAQLSLIFAFVGKKVKPYKHSDRAKKAQVTEMFNNISKEYDSLNRVISLGIDVKWRKKVIEYVLATHPKNVLDVATGTGDLAIAMAKAGVQHIVGLDISNGMLEVGRKKVANKPYSDKIEFTQGDSENLPFEANTFDAVTVAFGIRNFENLEIGLAEILRVLKPNGIFVILETSVPTKSPYKQGYNLYCKYVLPVLGRLFSRDKFAYKYLSDSAAVFPHGAALNNILTNIGFINATALPQTFGAASIYLASK